MPRGGAKFSTDELALVLSHYDLGTIQSTKPLQAGDRRAPKRIICSEKGKFLIKRRSHGKDDLYRVAFAHSLQAHLAKKNFPLSVVISTKNNNTIVNVNDHIYELFLFIEGHRYDLSSKETSNAGGNLGQFHRQIADFPNQFKPLRGTFHDSTPVRGHLRSILKKQSSQSLDQIGEQLAIEYNHASTNVNQLGFDSWPEQIIHGDWHPGNMLFANNQVCAVLDFDSIKIAPTICDLANGALHFSIVGGRPNPSDWPEYLDFERFKAFVLGYLSIVGLDNDQLNSLCDLMIETMIAEAVLPIAATGSFGHLSGEEFLKMINRKCKWIRHHKQEILATVFD